MSGDGLRVCGVSVPEQATLVRAHLEQAEVLPVLGRRRQARLAPGDSDRLLAVPTEHSADRRPRSRLGESASPPRFGARTNDLSVEGDLPRHLREVAVRTPERRQRSPSVLSRVGELPLRVEEPDCAPVRVRSAKLHAQPRLGGPRTGVLRGMTRLRRAGGSGLPARRGGGVGYEREHAQAGDEGFQNENLLIEDRGAARPKGSRSCQSVRTTVAEPARGRLRSLT